MSCSTANITGYMAGKGVTGHTCDAMMKEGDTCQAKCGVGQTAINTIKCLGGSIKDVSLCVPTELLHTMGQHEATKVIGAWDIGLTGEPTNAQLTKAVIAGFELPKHFVETVWLADKKGQTYTVKYWIIVKPGLEPDVILTKAKVFPFSNSTQYWNFKNALEGNSTMQMTSIVEVEAPVAVRSKVLKDRTGQNVNPYEGFFPQLTV